MNHPETQIAAIVLAAGKGTRMKSQTPKVLQPAAGLPLIAYPLKTLQKAGVKRIVIVEGVDQALRQSDLLLPHPAGWSFAVQDPPLGTGHAVGQALPALKDFKGSVLIMYGDVPLIQTETLLRLVGKHQDARAALTFATATLDHYPPYGRIVRDAKGNPLRIVEARDASDEERKINEFNVGLYLADADFLREALAKLSNKNDQGEYYLTDLVASAASAGKTVQTIGIPDELEWQGVNNQIDRSKIEERILRDRRDFWKLEGVRMHQDTQIWLDEAVQLSPDAVLHGPLSLEGACEVGSGAVIEMGCVLRNSKVLAGARIKAHSYIEDSVVGEKSSVGPFAHLRPQSILGRGVKVGNFVELKKTRMEDGAKASHLTYLGDATVGKDANIGCGTITCNYDGFEKFQTVIEEGVFIGSDTQLVAPVTIGKEAFVGAGSTITKDVAPGSLAVSRTTQTEIPGWVEKFKSKKKKKKK